MAEEQKNVEVPKDIKAEENVAPAIATEPAVEETTTTADKPAEVVAKTEEPTAGASTEDKPAEEAKPEETAEEVKPIEEGHLGHKAQGASFPKNFIPSKEFFFFGTESYEPKSLSNYLKNEKSAAVYHSNVAWASETGKGLLFSGDKKAPTGVINLSDAGEPEVEGPNKFTLTAKGNKHSFKAANTAERDNWVAQLKLKIAEAKELSATVTESETYKRTLESFKPAKKEEKAAAPSAAATTTEATAEEGKADEPAKEGETAAEAETEAAKEEPKAESPKPLKNKRASFFSFLKPEEKEKKTEDKVEDKPAEDKPAEDATAAAVTAPAVEEPVAAEAEPTKSQETPAEETKPAESPKEKTSKRNSFFGNILSKKEKKTAEAKTPDATEAPKGAESPKAEGDAPVIPPVEATTPLADAVNNDANAPATVDTPETAAAATSEPKKDPKEKRKSSIPFLGKRDKSPAPAEGEEKPPKSSAFSKLRATIKGKGAAKPEEKTEKTEEPKETETAEPAKEEAAAEPAKVEDPVTEEVKKTEAEPAAKPENVATTTPAVTAAA